MNIIIILILFVFDFIVVKKNHDHAFSLLTDIVVAGAAANAIFSLQFWEQSFVFLLTVGYMVYRLLLARIHYKQAKKQQDDEDLKDVNNDF